jgi:purine-nucleoside phosphorylase
MTTASKPYLLSHAERQSRLREAIDYVSKQTALRPKLAVILGSGLGDFADSIDGVKIPSVDIPYMPQSTAPHHEGVLHFGTLNGMPVIGVQGRVHLYEGYSAADVAFIVELLHGLGVETLILTNISGSLNPEMTTGEIVSLSDHIFLPGFAGVSPLTGKTQDETRTPFVNLTTCYDSALLAIADTSERGPLQRAIYACLGGPQLETPAEGRLLRALGADIVGMSTVPEAIMARYLGLRVLGLSLIVNPVITDRETQAPLDEAEIWAAAEKATLPFQALVMHCLTEISKENETAS